MANRSTLGRSILVAAALLAIVLAHRAEFAMAQENGDRPVGDRGGRGDRREWRRGGGPNGERRRDRDRGPSGDDGNTIPPAPRPTVPPPATATSSTSFGTVSETDRIRKSASDTIKKNDKDGDGILAGDELNDLGMSRGADKDGDGKITHNELVAFRTPKSASTASAPTSQPKVESSTSSTESTAERKIVNTSRKSYRFKSTKERLKSWKFASKDVNADGQVSMDEYARSWTDRTAAEFQRYDKDNDGMITAEEAK